MQVTLQIEVHKNKAIVENGCTWFTQIKASLDEEFKAICDSSLILAVRDDGKIIKTVKELQERIDEKRKICLSNKSSYGKKGDKIRALIVLLLVGCFHYLQSGPNDDKTGLGSTTLFLIVCGIIFYRIHILKQSEIRKEAKRSLAPLLELYQSACQKNAEIRSDENIKKFFFVSDEEIKALSEVSDKYDDGEYNMDLPQENRNEMKCALF